MVEVIRERYRFFALGLSTTHYGLIYGTAFSLPVVMLLVMEALDLSYAGVSLFLTVYGITWCFGMIPGGWLTNRYGIRRVLAIGTVANGIFLIIWSLAPPYPVMCLLYGLMGLGTGITWPPTVALVTRWFNHEEHGRALGIMNGGGTGIVMILYSLATPAIAALYSWQGPFRILPISLFVWVVIFLLTLRLPPITVDESQAMQDNSMAEQPTTKLMLRNPTIWVIGIIGASYLVQFFVFFTFLPAYLQEIAGFSLKTAGLGAMIFLAAGIPAAITGGIVADRIGILKTQLIGCLITASAVIMATRVITDWALLAPILFLIGWGPYFALGPYYGLIRKLVPPEQEASTIGVISFIQWSPGMFVPVLSGWMLEQTGSYVPMFWLATISPLIGAALSLVARRYVGTTAKVRA